MEAPDKREQQSVLEASNLLILDEMVPKCTESQINDWVSKFWTVMVETSILHASTSFGFALGVGIGTLGATGSRGCSMSMASCSSARVCA